MHRTPLGRPLFPLLVLLATVPLAATCGDPDGGRASDSGRTAAEGSAPPTPPADHHLHAWSGRAVDALLRLQEATGESVISDDEAAPLRAENALAALDSAGVERGVLLSTAYFFGSPDIDFENERPRVQAENDFVAEQVGAAPDRLTGFCSVNPLAAYALEEIRRCDSLPAITGLKLHLANSDVDLHDARHVERLRRVFGTANDLGMPLVVHLQTRREGFGRAEADTFIDEVLPAAPDVPVQVAHLGGNSGYDPATHGAVQAFLAAFEDHPERTDRVYFDLAAVPLPISMAGDDSARIAAWKEVNARIAEAVRKIGPDRIVYGTDWPAVSVPRYLAGVRESLPLEAARLRNLLDDAAPYLEG